jgi:hypothetical protein
MFATLRRFAVLIAATAALPAAADPAQVEHGRDLVTIMGCTDCHAPGHFLGQPDMTRFLGGSDVGFEIPGLGTFYGPNLTPTRPGRVAGRPTRSSRRSARVSVPMAVRSPRPCPGWAIPP